MCFSDHVFDLRKRSRTFFGECPYYEPKSEKRGFYASERTNSDYLGYMDKGHRSGKYSDYMDYQGKERKAPACSTGMV